MTDSYFAITVLLEKDVREDDIEHILNAIRMIKRVMKVEPLIANPELDAAEERVRREYRDKLYDIIWPKGGS